MNNPFPTTRKNQFLSCCGCLTIIVIALVVLGAIGASTGHSNDTSSTNTSTHTNTPSATNSKPTETLWIVTHSFSGNGSKKTEVFSVGDTWRLGWSCDPASFYGSTYNVQISVKGSDDSFLDPYTINTICSKMNTGDATIEHRGGNVYLDINSSAAWKVDVSEIK